MWALQVGGQWNDDWLIQKSVEVNEYLVEAKRASLELQRHLNIEGGGG